jgi:hypothetical protein
MLYAHIYLSIEAKKNSNVSKVYENSFSWPIDFQVFK